ncbi:class I SAM-dependent methyltransferase [Aquicella lusitana]|uniref:Methyltransferase family protein n=1 Tax=Aquicella lusitana TaxID=254246 RepID=A0A370GRW2_9COXI|nr:class I SAM-dependent methyltransferase [Aquicella lusitana]RDI46060.1 methyltransferase family protein [Aquicella lusitana]VVC73343.1 hypothetical protein AQULUS_10820 [Aquicella lusitana]
MAHGYRTLQHWNQWLTQQFLGADLLNAEQALLSRMLAQHFGRHALLIGVPHQHALLSSTKIPCQTLISPLISREKNDSYVEGDLHELPILTGSIDLVMLPHTLEFVDNPRQLLSETCRIIKPEGLIVICGFNPYSAWGLRKRFTKHPTGPWSGNFIQASKVKGWLKLAEFAMEKQVAALFRPPTMHQTLYNKLHFLEQIGSICFPVLGGIYILLARAKVIPLTPIRLKWKQQPSSIRISTSISGHIARQSK